MTPTKQCTSCGQVKKLEEFNFKDKKAGILNTRCRECMRTYAKRHYEDNREYYIEKAAYSNEQLTEQHLTLIYNYLSTHPCMDCGETDVVCLEFDHVRGKKFKNITHMIGNFNWSRIEAEIAKCEIRCANCHRIKTAKQFGYWNADYT